MILWDGGGKIYAYSFIKSRSKSCHFRHIVNRKKRESGKSIYGANIGLCLNVGLYYASIFWELNKMGKVMKNIDSNRLIKIFKTIESVKRYLIFREIIKFYKFCENSTNCIFFSEHLSNMAYLNVSKKICI